MRDAIDAVREVTGSDDVNVIGFCAGGIITTTLLNHLAAIGDERVHSMSYAVTLLDFEFGDRAPITAIPGPGLLRFAKARSRRTGIITSRQMGAAFTWMRPDDLVFNYWVNNYLMGDKPPAFDILAWNADGTNLPGALHGEFLDIFESNLLAKPGGGHRAGHARCSSTGSRSPTFVTGAVTDHLTPWLGCYRTTQLLGGEVDVRAELLRAHREPGQPARQPEGALLDRRRARARSAEVARRAPTKQHGQLVGGLDRVVRAPRAAASRRRRAALGSKAHPVARPRARPVRARPARVIPTAGTDPPSRVPPWRSASTRTRTATVFVSCAGRRSPP